MGKKETILIVGLLIFVVIFLLFWKSSTLFDPENGPESVNFCSKFKETEGEITCKDAIKLVLEGKSGQIKCVEASSTSFLVGKPPQTEEIRKDVWIIGALIKNSSLPTISGETVASSSLALPTKIEFFVDKIGKNILFYKTGNLECLK